MGIQADLPSSSAAQGQLLERFLVEFHEAHPGVTSHRYASLPVEVAGQFYGSSYDVLVAALPPNSETVLDLGCGDGVLLERLAAKSVFQRLVGIDISPAELRLARMRVSSSTALCQGRAQNLPFATHTFDGVLSHLTLMLMPDPERVVDEIQRVLKPGALLAATISSGPPRSQALTEFVNALSRYPRRPEWSSVQFGDRRLQSPDGIRELLAARFVDVDFAEVRISRRLAPREAWLAVRDTYNLGLLDDSDLASFERDYLSALSALKNDDGKLPVDQALLTFIAKAR